MFKSLNLFFPRTIIMMLFTAFIPLSVFAPDHHDDISVVYHVIIDEKHIGTISNKELINDLILSKMKKLDNEYKDLELTTSKDITYIPEYTFFPNTDDEQALNWIKENIVIEAVAFELAFEDQLLYLKEKKDAVDTLNQLKLQFVSSEDLDTLNNNKRIDDNQDQVLYISYSTQPTINSAQVSPDAILSVDEAVNYITKGSLQQKEYFIQQGDVLSTIAQKFEMTIDELLKLNPEYKNDQILPIGQSLIVTDYQPLTDIIVQEQLNKAEMIDFETKVVEDDKMYKGDSQIKQQGMNGKKNVLYKLTKKNGSLVKEEIIDETIVEETIPEIVVKGTKVISSRGTGKFAWPTVGGYVSSEMGLRWGRTHKGTDIARPSKLDILAADNGTVTFAGWSGGYGNKIEITHNNGYKTTYSHMKSLSVQTGETVVKGTQIGVMGATGNSTGIHLHIELFKNGQLKDFLQYAK